MLKKITITFLIIMATIAVLVFYYKKDVKEQKVSNILDQLTLTLESQLENHNMDDLQVAILLSKNSVLINALENDDEDKGYKILSDIAMSIFKNTDRNIRAQIITKNLDIFARSWDDMYAGMPIGDFRTDLKYFKTHATPRTALVIGRRLGIKATVPIYKNGKLLGFVEVISFFKSITEFFSSIGVDLYVLLDINNMNSAVLMMQNIAIQKYVIANRTYNNSHIQTLNSLNFKELQLNGVVHKDKKYIFYENMYNGNSDIIGGFVFVMPERYIDYFRNPEDDISFLINLTRSSMYNIEREERSSNSLYKEYEANSMIYLLDVIDKEDREVFLGEAYDKFDTFSKDELIQMILNRKIVKKIDGKIK